MPRLPPAEKLPLAVRKNIRDEWESKKAGHEKNLSEILGETWTIDINPNAIFPYGAERSYATESTGSCINNYVDDAIRNLKSFLESDGDIIKDELNSVASAHVLTMDFDENKKFSYCGCEISSSGQMVILFSEGNLGSNINNAFDKNHITKALNEAPSTPSGLSFISRLYITQVYNKEIPKTQEKINKLLQTEITLDPNFEQTFSTLKASKTKMRNNDWEENLGSFLRYYFEGLVSNLESAKFGEDDMLMEGFTDAVDKSRVSFRIVDAGVMKASYNECVIEDGVLYIQTTEEYFGSNMHNTGEKIIDLL